MAKNRFFFHLLALVIVAVWGITFVSTKTLINAGMHPTAIFFIRFVMAYAGIWVYSLLEKKPVKIWSDSRKDEWIFVFLGITGGSIYFLAENTSLAYTQASNVSFLVCTAPLFTALLTLAYKRFFRGRFADGMEDIRVGFPLIFGTLLALVGMAMVVFDGTRLQVSPKGDLLALGAALCWALYSLFMSPLTQKYGAVFATRKVFFYGLVTILPFLGSTGDSFSPAVLSRPVVYGNLLFLGLIASLGCFIAWNKVMVKLGNVTSTNYVYLNPIFTLITAMVLLGERMTLVSGLGCAAILAGVVLSGLKPWRAYRRAASFLSLSGSNGRSKKASGSEGCH